MVFSAKKADRVAGDISAHTELVRTDILDDAVGGLKHDRPADEIPQSAETRIYDERTLVPDYRPESHKWVDEL